MPFPRGKQFIRLVIRAPPGDDGDFVSAFRQCYRQFGKMLAGGHHIGITSLIKQEDFQKMKLKVPSVGFLI
jgi:hypothetical protein